MPKFRKKPVVIDAVQYSEHGKLVTGMCNSSACFSNGNTEPHVHTIHDNQIVNLEVGDWVIPEPNGINFYPCKPDIFEKTYEPANWTDGATEKQSIERMIEVFTNMRDYMKLKGLHESAFENIDKHVEILKTHLAELNQNKTNGG